MKEMKIFKSKKEYKRLYIAHLTVPCVYNSQETFIYLNAMPTSYVIYSGSGLTCHVTCYTICILYGKTYSKPTIKTFMILFL